MTSGVASLSVDADAAAEDGELVPVEVGSEDGIAAAVHIDIVSDHSAYRSYNPTSWDRSGAREDFWSGDRVAPRCLRLRTR